MGECCQGWNNSAARAVDWKATGITDTGSISHCNRGFFSLSQLAVQTHIISGSCHKHHFCRDKCFVATKHVFCCNKSMLAVTTFVATKLCLSWQNIFCHKTFVVTNICGDKRVCCEKSKLVMTTLLPRQNYICHDKNMFVTTSILLSRQKMYFVVTYMIFVAAPANDTLTAFIQPQCAVACINICGHIKQIL